MSDAIVLKTSAYSESTLIVSLLMREGGVARVLAKGARRMKGQNGAAFDLFAHVKADLRAARGDRLGILRAIDLRDSRTYLRHDLARFALASLVMEVLGAVAGTSHEEPWFYDEATEYLRLLEAAPMPGSLTALVLMRLLHHAGHPPQLGGGLDAAALPERLVYDFGEGEVREAAGLGGVRHLPVSREMIARVAHMLGEEPPALDPAFNAGAREGPALLKWLIRIWQEHLAQPLKSAQFLEKMDFGRTRAEKESGGPGNPA